MSRARSASWSPRIWSNAPRTPSTAGPARWRSRPHGKAVLNRLQQTSQAGLREALAGFDDADIATTVTVLNHLVAYARRKHTAEEQPRGREA